jgi:catechol 2,3-dioxygenase-like lactoylglutathione lyase family enzyme
MTIQRVVPNLTTEDTAAAKAFYGDFLGFDIPMDEPGFMTAMSPDVPAAQLNAGTERGVRELAVSIGVDNVDELYADAQARGVEVVYPLTEEPWGVRRFFVRAPGGHVINVVQHLEAH